MTLAQDTAYTPVAPLVCSDSGDDNKNPALESLSALRLSDSGDENTPATILSLVDALQVDTSIPRIVTNEVCPAPAPLSALVAGLHVGPTDPDPPHTESISALLEGFCGAETLMSTNAPTDCVHGNGSVLELVAALTAGISKEPDGDGTDDAPKAMLHLACSDTNSHVTDQMGILHTQPRPPPATPTGE